MPVESLAQPKQRFVDASHAVEATLAFAERTQEKPDSYGGIPPDCVMQTPGAYRRYAVQAETIRPVANRLGVDVEGAAMARRVTAVRDIRDEAQSIDDLLANPLVRIDERNDELGRYAVRIGELRTRIRIELGRARSSDRTRCDVSHTIRTPLQDILDPEPPLVSDSWTGALGLAIDRLTTDYQQAVAAGYKPHDWWLVTR